MRHRSRNFIQEFASELRVAKEYMKSNIASAAELRTSFLIQVFGMMFNNLAFLMVWWLFIHVFGNFNGWTTNEVIALEGFIALIFGLSFSLAPGTAELPAAINNGSFDTLLLTPRNIYLRIMTLKTRPSAIGDALYGILALIAYTAIASLSMNQVLLLILLIIPATVIFINFTLITSCIGFYIPDSVETSKNAFEIMFGPSFYPAGVFRGAMRFIFLFILPTLAIGGLPVEAVKDFDLTKVVIVWMLAIAWTLIALFTLKRGIRRYESGNLTGARV